MSKKTFRSQASSSKAGFGSAGTTFGSVAFGHTPGSVLSYVYEPPDLSRISDSTIVVSLKNLQKKDGTTKSKALEELQAYVAFQGENKDALEDAFLDAWARLFSRISIDNARRVRQLVYLVHGSIVTLCGRRFVKHMPATVGPWLAGLQDGDRPVARSAQESLTKTFPSLEKQNGVWKSFHQPIIEYAVDTTLKESPQTLSDERTVSPDDAEAKYSRAIGGALMTVASAVETLSREDIQNCEHLYRQLLQSDIVWGLASSKDSFLRKAVYRLLLRVLDKHQLLLDIQVVGNHIIKALDTEQIGSMTDFLKVVISVSRNQPEIWTTLYTGSSKKSPSRRLNHFLRKGSQGGGPEVWTQIGTLLELIPQDAILSKKDGEAQEEPHLRTQATILQSLREGVARKNEIRTQQKDAWQCYLGVARRIIGCLVEPEIQGNFLQEFVLPLFKQFVKPELETLEWGHSGLELQPVSVEALNIAFSYSPATLEESVNNISDSLVEDLKTSLPEQSKGFTKSQNSILDQFVRWYGVQASVIHNGPLRLTETLLGCVLSEVDSAIGVLDARHGKPYSAAAVLQQAAHLVAELQGSANEPTNIPDSHKLIVEKLINFAQDKLPLFMGSSSSLFLVQLLQALEPFGPLDSTWKFTMEKLVAAEASAVKEAALEYLVSRTPWSQQEDMRALLSKAVLADLKRILSTDEGKWSLVNATIKNPQAPKPLKEEILVEMTESLSITTKTEQALEGFENMLRHDRQAFEKLLATSQGSQLLSKLMYLSQEGDEIVQAQATKLRALAVTSIAKDTASAPTSNPVLAIIRDGIMKTGEEALSIESLVSQTSELLQTTHPGRATEVFNELFPPPTQWAEALQPFLKQPVDDALAVINPLGGAIYLVSERPNPFEVSSRDYDREGRSAPLRMAMFACRVVQATEQLRCVADESVSSTYRFIAVTAQLANDHLSVMSPCPLYKRSRGIDESEIIDSIAELQSFCAHWIRVTAAQMDDMRDNALSELYEAAEGSSIASYYHARAYAAAISEQEEVKGIYTRDRIEAEIPRIRKQPRFLSDIALLAGASKSEALIRLLNELIADITHWDFENTPQDGLKKVVMLNVILQAESLPLEEIPHQRIVFFVQHVSNILQSSVSTNIESELLKSLAAFLPLVKSIYGEFWESILNAVPEGLESESSSLPLVHAILRLTSNLSKVVALEDSNEDLQESWVEAKPKIADGLLLTLMRHASVSDAFNQPLKIVNGLLSRQISAFADSMKLSAEDMYPIMASESTTLQRSAYEALHKAIPLAQEQVSLDAALSKEFTPKLSEELLSLILGAPSADDYLDLQNEPEIPPPLARYLLSWKLIFDHWTNASYKVQADYVANLKENSSISYLLSFTFSALITNHGKNPYDPTKLSSTIETYNPDPNANPAAETYRLITHLYYLILLHTPYLAKDWYTNSCPRALKSQVESWTEKHISPLVISAELAVVSTWEPPAATSTATDSAVSPEITIKISPRFREASVSLPMDETQLSIRILLPPTYPLSPINIATSNRVGIEERKWQGFINISRIVMNFSSTSQGLGCVVDGIAIWRSNVLSALRGQGECAICYSVVSEDRKVPDKRCATCKNCFHGLCLYKWFQRSSGSSCPLCRNAFNYA